MTNGGRARIHAWEIRGRPPTVNGRIVESVVTVDDDIDVDINIRMQPSVSDSEF